MMDQFNNLNEPDDQIYKDSKSLPIAPMNECNKMNVIKFNYSKMFDNLRNRF